MNIPLFTTLLILLGASFIWLGKRASRTVKTFEDYFLGGRKLGFFALTMTLLATQLGGGALMGAADEAYKGGWMVIFYPMGMVLGLLLLGLGFGAKLRKLNLTTVAEIFETVYGAPSLRKIASILSIVSLFLILIGQGIAARKFFISLGFDTNWLFIGFWLVFVFYTVLGGLKAVVDTDIVQAGFILGALVLVFFVSFGKSAEIPLTVAKSQSPVPWLEWLMMPLLYMLIEQDMGQRCFAARKPKIVSLSSCITAAVLLLACLCPIYFGTMAARMGLQVPEGASVLITSAKALTSPTVATVLICAILMAIISTADSLLCSISSNLACDFATIRKKPVLVSQAITFVTGSAALVFAFFFDNVVAMLMLSYELAVSILFVPIIMALFWKNPLKRSAAASMAIGGAGYFFFPFWATLPLAFLGFMGSEAFALIRQKQKHVLKSD